MTGGEGGKGKEKERGGAKEERRVRMWSVSLKACSFPPPYLELLRPLARSASNAALFAPNADPELIRFENCITDTNRMYTMRTIGVDTSSQASWDRWLDEGKEVLVGNNIPRVLIAGEEDGVFNPGNCKKLKEKFEIADECYHVLEGAGHLPMLETPEEVSRILIDFLCSGELQCKQPGD